MAADPANDHTADGTETSSKQRPLWVYVLVFALVIGALIWGLVVSLKNSPGRADAGSCLKDTLTDDLSVVECDSEDAKYKILGRVDDKTQAEATTTACDKFAKTTDIYWSGTYAEASKGFVLCLTPVE